MTNDDIGNQAEKCTQCGLLIDDCSCKTLLVTNTPVKKMSEVKGTAEQRKIGRYTGGQLINNRYVIKRIVGIGGMGTVYEASHVSLRTKVAIKTLKTELIDDPSVMVRFEQEARACAALNHPNLVNVYDCDVSEEGEPYLVMEFLEGKQLLGELKSSGKLDLDKFFDIFLQVVSGLEYAHRNSVIHRDLKPANIIITEGPRGDIVPKIVDFGIAKIEDLGGNMQMLTQTGEVVGSPAYMAPEQCSGSKIDQRTDIYALGCIFYECVSGKQAFVGENMLTILDSQLNKDPKPLRELPQAEGTPDSLIEIIEKCLNKDPDYRFSSCKQLYSALEEARDGLIASHTFSIFGNRLRFETLVGLLVSLAILLCIVNFQHLLPPNVIKRLFGENEKKVAHLSLQANRMLSDLTYGDYAAESFVLEDAIPEYKSILDNLDDDSAQSKVAVLKSMMRAYARAGNNKQGVELYEKYRDHQKTFDQKAVRDIDNRSFATNLVQFYQYAAFCHGNLRNDFEAQNLYLKAIRLSDELNVHRWIEAKIHLEYSDYLREILKKYSEAYKQAVKAEHVLMQVEEPKRKLFSDLLGDAYNRQCWTSWAVPDRDRARAEAKKALDIYIEYRNKYYVADQYNTIIELLKQQKKFDQVEVVKKKRDEVVEFIEKHPYAGNPLIKKRLDHHPDQLRFKKNN